MLSLSTIVVFTVHVAIIGLMRARGMDNFPDPCENLRVTNSLLYNLSSLPLDLGYYCVIDIYVYEYLALNRGLIISN